MNKSENCGKISIKRILSVDCGLRTMKWKMRARVASEMMWTFSEIAANEVLPSEWFKRALHWFGNLIKKQNILRSTLIKPTNGRFSGSLNVEEIRCCVRTNAQTFIVIDEAMKWFVSSSILWTESDMCSAYRHRSVSCITRTSQQFKTEKNAIKHPRRIFHFSAKSPITSNFSLIFFIFISFSPAFVEHN